MSTDDWITYLAQRNRSPETIRTYRSVMNRYSTDPLNATTEQAEQWWQDHVHLAPKTRQKMLATVRSFYEWAMRFDLVAADPTRRLDAPTQGRRLPEPISRSDLRTALSKAEPDMYRAIALGAYAGLRVSEAASMSWENIDRDARRLFVRAGKGDKDRAVGLSPLLLDAILPESGGNVVTAGGPAMSPATLQRKVNRHLERCGIKGTFHKLRARFATVALAETGNLLAVSRALGHSSPSTTAIYAATSDEDLDLIAAAVTR